MEARNPRANWKTLLAFAIIYFVWGTTFLAIRIGVREAPPFLLAGMDFLITGAAVYFWAMARGERSPTRTQWAGATALAILFFVLDNGLLFWGERRVLSGIAALMMAMIPVFIVLAEIVLLRTQRLTFRLAMALLMGICGVAVMANHSLSLGGAPIDGAGCAALILGSLCWAVGSVLARKLTLPRSKILSSGMQMLIGGFLLTLAAAALGELRGFRPWDVSSAVRPSACESSLVRY